MDVADVGLRVAGEMATPDVGKAGPMFDLVTGEFVIAVACGLDGRARLDVLVMSVPLAGGEAALSFEIEKALRSDSALLRTRSVCRSYGSPDVNELFVALP